MGGRAIAGGNEMIAEPAQDERYDLPPGWVWAKLEELIKELESGSRPRGGVRGIKHGVPSIGGEHLNQSGGFDFSSMRFVPETFAACMKKGWIQPNDILIVKDGATTGKASFVDDRFPYSKAVLNEHVFRLRALSKIVDQGYLFRFLWGRVGQRMIAKAFRGTAQGGINQSFLRFVDVPLGPLPEQRRIVSKIEALFEESRTARQALDRIQPLLKKFRQAVLAAAFRGDLTRDWREQHADVESASILRETLRRFHAARDKRSNAAPPTEGVHTLQRSDFPDSWELAELSELCEPIRPITYGILKPGPDRADGVAYVRVADMIGEEIILHKIRRTSKEVDKAYKRSRLSTGDVLLSIRGTVGRVCIVPRQLDGANITQDTARISVDLRVPAEYVAICLRSPSLQKAMAAATRGVAVRGINIGDVRALQVPLPPLAEQRQIVARVQQLLGHGDRIGRALEVARRRAEKLEQSILARAFRGELVPQDPNDEPAPILLGRIGIDGEMAGASKRLRSDGLGKRKHHAPKRVASS